MQLSICVIIIMMMISKLAMHFSQKIHFLYVEVDMRVTYLVLKFKCVNNCFASNMLLIFKWWNSKIYTYIGIDFTLKVLTYFSLNGVLRAGLWECQVQISHRHIRRRPNLLSYSHSHCIIVSKRESWFDVRTEPKKIKFVCEQWVTRPLCVNSEC